MDAAVGEDSEQSAGFRIFGYLPQVAGRRSRVAARAI